MKIYVRISFLPTRKEIKKASDYLYSLGCTSVTWHQGLVDSNFNPMGLVIGTKENNKK